VKTIRLGQVDYINCLPVYQGLDVGQVKLEAEIVKGVPTDLNRLFLNGALDVTPISSIEYAKNADKCLILPNLSISADGMVKSILLFSKIPVTELDGKKVCLTSSSATSVVLLRILLEHYYHVNVEFVTAEPRLPDMLEIADAALLIGDDALIAQNHILSNSLGCGSSDNFIVTDLGEVWKQFTGEKMVYALWVIKKEFAENNPDLVHSLYTALKASKAWGIENSGDLTKLVLSKHPLLEEEINDYFKTILYDFSEDFQRGLLTFYDYAYKSGLIEERIRLQIWGDIDNEGHNEYSR